MENEGNPEPIHGGYSPVDAFLHIGVRRVGPEESPGVVTRQAADLVLAGFKELPDHDDKVLSAWLKMINSKIDALLGLLDKGRMEFDSLPLRPVRLSGGGMSLPYDGECAPGEMLELKVMLPIFPPVALHIYGKAVRREGETVYVSFLPMDEEIRDKIIHYVFLRQREVIRERRENQGENG